MKLEIPKNVLCLAVVKNATTKKIEAIIKEGFANLGWNTVQHLTETLPLLAGHQYQQYLKHHFIGHLQRNKVRMLLEHPIELIHSVDSQALIEKINVIAGELGKKQAVLLQINTDPEKEYGLSVQEAREILEMRDKLPFVKIEGFMTIPAANGNARTIYKGLRMQRDKLEKECGTPLSTLSMGMSDDYKIALEEGATIIRLGKILFK